MPRAATRYTGRSSNELERSGLTETGGDTSGPAARDFCERGTIVSIEPKQVTYLQVKPEDVPEIVATTLVTDEVVDRLLYHRRATAARSRAKTTSPSTTARP